MSSVLPEDEANPYAAPKTDIGAAILEPGDAEAIRRTYIEHETTVKAVGSLHIVVAALAAFILGFAAVGVIFFSGRRLPSDFVPSAGIGLFVGVGLNAALGLGLNRLRPWARWSDVVLSSIALVGMGVLIASLVYLERPGRFIFIAGLLSLMPVYVLYLLLSRKGVMIFSDEYRAIIAKTPHVKYVAGRPETSLMERIVLGTMIGLLLIFLLSFLILA
jgi:hypothetical protein